VDDTPSELRLAQESGDGGFVLAEFVLEDFDRDGPMFRVFGAIYYGSPAFPDTVEKGIAGEFCSNERVSSHAAKLTLRTQACKRNDVTDRGYWCRCRRIFLECPGFA
jgi:hypothetical protein